MDGQSVFYLDECGGDHRLYREHGRSPRGERIYQEVCGKRRERTSLIAASRKNKLVAPLVFQGSCNTEVVDIYFTQVLRPVLPPGSVIVWDNARFHQSPTTQKLVEATGCRLLFLPPYSPDLNPIEHLWAAFKARRHQPLSFYRHDVPILLLIAIPRREQGPPDDGQPQPPRDDLPLRNLCARRSPATGGPAGNPPPKKHGSWLNLAEIELSALNRQCLNRRLPTQECLRTQIAAWPADRNHRGAPINWRFTAEDARIKLTRLYPKLYMIQDTSAPARTCVPAASAGGEDSGRRAGPAGSTGHGSLLQADFAAASGRA